MDMIFEAKRMPNIGESIVASSLFTFPGGKGANMAIATCRACHFRPLTNKPQGVNGNVAVDLDDRNNIRVFMNGAVGDDGFGTTLKMKLEENGVDTSGLLIVKGESTGTCVVLVEESSGDNRLLAYQGANMMWEPHESRLVECLAGGAKPDLVITHLGIQQEKVKRVLETASRSGIDTLLNPSPPEPLDGNMYKYLTHLIMNETEAAMLSGISVEELNTLAAWDDGAQYFLRQGVKNVVITLADKGAYYATNTGEKNLVYAEKNVNIVDVTGAGDTFVGNYAVEFVKQNQLGEWDIGKAIVRACKAAARTIEHFGAQESSPWADEVNG